MKGIKCIFVVVLYAILTIGVNAEEIRYITDQFEIVLQKNKDPNSATVARLKSGTPVEVLETAGVDGYTKVQTLENKVGWVLESFLMLQPSGRDQFLVLNKDYQELKAGFNAQLQERTKRLSSEIVQLKKLAKQPLKIQEENQQLKKILEQERAQTAVMKKENLAFKSINKDRQWLITGALISIGSLILGLVITKIPWRKRKSWGEV